MARQTRRLVLNRKAGQRVRLTVGAQEVWVEVVAVSGQQVRLRLTAPPEVVIVREELIGRPKKGEKP